MFGEKEVAKNCRVFTISKRNGKFRTVYAPGAKYKAILRSMRFALTDTVIKMDKNRVNHAFLPDRNCVTNALAHIGRECVLSFDLADFFDYVTFRPA